jgi:hypothetical protein
MSKCYQSLSLLWVLMGLLLPLRASATTYRFSGDASSYTGPVSITGNQTNGADQLSNVNVNGVLNVKTYGASGTATAPTSTTASTTASSASVTLGAADNLFNGEGIAIYGAGANCSINSTACGSITAPTPAVTLHGYTGGSTSYAFKIAACDANYGCTAPGTATSVNGPAMLVIGMNYIDVTWTPTTGAAHYAVCVNRAGAGYQLLATQDLPGLRFGINNPATNNGPLSLPGNAKDLCTHSAVVNDVFVGTVATGGGTTSITVSGGTPSQSGSGFTAWPDDTAAFQAAIDAASTGGAKGGDVYAPKGFYKVRRITMDANVKLRGAHVITNTDPSVAASTNIQGTGEYDLFYVSNVSNIAISDLNTTSGRNSIAQPNTSTFIKLNNLYLAGADFGGITTNQATPTALVAQPVQQAFEEWYLNDVNLQAQWYGFDQEGHAYMQKDQFANSFITGQNGIHIDDDDVTSPGTGETTFEGLTINGTWQDAIWWVGPSTGSMLINRLTTEGVGQNQSTVANQFGLAATTTATCASGSNVVVVASATGLSVGDHATVNGCKDQSLDTTIPGGGGSGWLEGTICTIAGTSITLKDPTCTTAVNAGQTLSGAGFTNAVFDTFGGAVSGLVTVANSDVTGGFVRTGINNGGGNVLIEVAGPGTIGCAAYDSNDTYTAIGVQGPICSRNSSRYQGPSLTAGAIKGVQTGEYSMFNSSRGGDLVLGLVDTNNNNSGTFGKLRITSLSTISNGQDALTVDKSGNAVAIGTVSAATGVKVAPNSLASFNTCNSGAEGTIGRANNCASTTLGTTCSGSGSTHAEVVCDGTNWKQMGF